MPKVKIILNPTAGMNSAANKIPQIKKALERRGIDYDLVLTERPGHAAEIAERTDPKDHGVVVAAGGDGTCNEVLNGLMKAKAEGRAIPVMGALAVGRGNDFHYGMGLPHDLEECIALLGNGFHRPMDVGKVVGGLYPGGRYFGNGVGVGFTTIVGFEAAKLKFIHGFITYVVGALKTLFLYYHAPRLRMVLDGQVTEQRSIETSVMIGRRFGGAFFMTPSSLNDDGLFDLCIAADAPRLEMLKLVGKYMKGTQNENRFVETRRARIVSLTALDGALAVHADGETICERGDRIDIECLAHQVEIVSQQAAERIGI